MTKILAVFLAFGIVPMVQADEDIVRATRMAEVGKTLIRQFGETTFETDDLLEDHRSQFNLVLRELMNLRLSRNGDLMEKVRQIQDLHDELIISALFVTAVSTEGFNEVFPLISLQEASQKVTSRDLGSIFTLMQGSFSHVETTDHGGTEEARKWVTDQLLVIQRQVISFTRRSVMPKTILALRVLYLGAYREELNRFFVKGANHSVDCNVIEGAHYYSLGQLLPLIGGVDPSFEPQEVENTPVR